MALTITAVHNPPGADRSFGVYDILCDNAYTANGYVLTAAMFGRKAIHFLIPAQQGTASRILTYDVSTVNPGKLRLWTAIGTEAAGASDQSSVTCRCLVIGPT